MVRYVHRGRKPPAAEKELLIETNLETDLLDDDWIPSREGYSGTGWGTGSKIFLITYYFFSLRQNIWSVEQQDIRCFIAYQTPHRPVKERQT